MKSLLIALGIVGTIPLLAAAQYHEAPQTTSRSVIKPVGFHHFHKAGCGCQEPAPTCTTCAPTCCTPVPPPSVGRCCPKPCLLERLHRGLRSLDCLLPCSLGCNSINCSSSCNSCTASCATKPSCGSCCTKSRAHFFAFCKPKCGFGCGSSCSVGCSTSVSCCDGVPAHMNMHPPVPPVDEGNPFKDDMRPMDPNTPPPGQNTYKPYWKKNNATARVTSPLPQPTPAKLDPYAAAPSVRIKAQPAAAQPTPAPKVASRPQAAAPAYAAVKVAVAQEVETVSLTIADDEPPAPPAVLPVVATQRVNTLRHDSSIPVNPLR